MIEIDGGAGESGGQLTRTALALAALTKQEIRIVNIRAKRPKPGLQPQHLAAVKTLAEICGAQLQGAQLHSTRLLFSPKQIRRVNLNVSIGTAGSISLLLSQILPVALVDEIKLRVVGGTNVAYSPPIEFLQRVLFPSLHKMGARLNLYVNKKGFFPKGNGIVSFSSKPAKLPLRSINLTELGELEFVEILSSSASLPTEVSRNQAIAARRALQNPLQHICSNLNAGNAEDIEFRESIESSESSATIGSAISIFAHFSRGAVLSGSALGEKGKPAERVGEEAARNLLSELGPKQPCDSHLADQLIPFMALAKGKSELRCTLLSQHCLTNIAVVEKFLPVKFAVEGELGKPAKISVEGAAFIA